MELEGWKYIMKRISPHVFGRIKLLLCEFLGLGDDEPGRIKGPQKAKGGLSGKRLYDKGVSGEDFCVFPG